MAHSIEDMYKKIEVMSCKANELRDALNENNTENVDEIVLRYMLDDIRSLARDVEHGLYDLDKD